ncbi:hypothetical protein B0H11DRAFT_1923931 [Mycena galericulata]|nr:hypothetical protein B0H11DRAFT_1923931 [Mycena galericulata]
MTTTHPRATRICATPSRRWCPTSPLSQRGGPGPERAGAAGATHLANGCPRVASARAVAVGMQRVTYPMPCPAPPRPCAIWLARSRCAERASARRQPRARHLPHASEPKICPPIPIAMRSPSRGLQNPPRTPPSFPFRDAEGPTRNRPQRELGYVHMKQFIYSVYGCKILAESQNLIGNNSLFRVGGGQRRGGRDRREKAGDDIDDAAANWSVDGCQDGPVTRIHPKCWKRESLPIRFWDPGRISQPYTFQAPGRRTRAAMQNLNRHAKDEIFITAPFYGDLSGPGQKNQGSYGKSEQTV